MQTGAAASSHDLTSRFKENTEGNKASEETSCQQGVKLFSEELQPKPQPTMSLESQGPCDPGLGSPSILDKCTLQPSCAELCFILHLLFRSTTTKKLP